MLRKVPKVFRTRKLAVAVASTVLFAWVPATQARVTDAADRPFRQRAADGPRCQQEDKAGREGNPDAGRHIDLRRSGVVTSWAGVGWKGGFIVSRTDKSA